MKENNLTVLIFKGMKENDLTSLNFFYNFHKKNHSGFHAMIS